MNELQPKSLFHERYRIEYKLGQGGMGVVYKAVDLRLERPVALKVLPELDDATRVARFEREAKAIARLNHPNIVVIYDFDTWQEQPYIAMEFLEGRDLSTVAPIEVALVLDAVLQVCSALDFAHRSGVIHRDLKPDNIRLLADNTAKLVDFGLALFFDSERLTDEGKIPGTEAYLAPEQLLGQRPSVKSDQYALGMVLYRLLSGDYPYLSDSKMPSVHQRIHREPERLDQRRPDLPPLLVEAVQRMLKVLPSERYASVAEARGDLKQARESIPKPDTRSPRTPFSPLVPATSDTLPTSHPRPLQSGMRTRTIDPRERLNPLPGKPGPDD